MAKTIAALFDNRTDVYSAVQDLLDHGYPHDISVLTQDDTRTEVPLAIEETPSAVEEGVGMGAAFGGLSGLVIGLSALLVPGIGPVLVVGPLTAALMGAGLGAAAGGLMGALTEMGLPEEQVHSYNEGVQRGGILVTVTTTDDQVAYAAAILARHNAVDCSRPPEVWRKHGWTHPEPHGHMEPAPHATASAVPSQDETHFRRHFNRTFAQDNGATYESYRPAYRYGYAVGSDEGSNGREWDSVESEVRRDWERQHQGTWEQFQVAIRSAWEAGRECRSASRL